MDERNITGRTTDVRTDYDRDVEIRRTAIAGRDYGVSGPIHDVALAPMSKALRWGPIMAGLTTSLVMSLLIGSLFLGLGFDRSFGVFGGVTAGELGWGAAVATMLAVFLGAYLAGYASDLRAKSEGVTNGFMVGVMTILTPLIAALFGSNMAAAVPDPAEPSVRNALVVAADNAWTVFTVGVLILGVAALGGYLGARIRESALASRARHDIDRPTTY